MTDQTPQEIVLPSRRDVVARELWKRDGLPVKAWDTGVGIIGCDGGGRVPTSKARDELRDVYRKSADSVLAALAALTPAAESADAATWDALLVDYHRWVAETIPHARNAAGLKLREEMAEFIAEPSPEEAADVALCLFNYAQQQGFDLLAAARAKHEKNKARTWERAPNGVWRHVKSDAAVTAALDAKGGGG